MVCTEYLWAEDTNGASLPFGIYYNMFRAGIYDGYGYIAPGSSDTYTCDAGVEYCAYAATDYTGWTKDANAHCVTNCSPDVTFVYIEDVPPTDYYVKTSGNDALTGDSWANAWKTINKAATTVLDGSTVHIEHGTYNAEPASNKIAPQNAGASGIGYKPEIVGGGAGTCWVKVEKN